MRRGLALLAAAIALNAWTPTAAAVINGTQDTSHPMVGMFVAAYAPADGSGPYALRFKCSGALISPRVFLTAGHCTNDVLALGATDVRVTFADPIGTDWSSFEPIVSASSWTQVDGYATYPGYRETNQSVGDGDVGILHLAKAVRNRGLLTLPTPGLLDHTALGGKWFSFVGYGTGTLYDKYWWMGPPHVYFDGHRNIGSAPYGALNAYYLRLQTNTTLNPSAGSFGPGDSGGPVFGMFAGHEVAVGVVSGAHALAGVQRLDERGVAAWLGEVLAEN